MWALAPLRSAARRGWRPRAPAPARSFSEHGLGRMADRTRGAHRSFLRTGPQ